MAKDNDKIELDGVVESTLPGSRFVVSLITEGFENIKVRARLSGKMRMHYIRIVPGDKVKLQISPNGQVVQTSSNTEEFTMEDEGLITYRPR
jgi:translation initiation factor IF-1